MALIPVSACSIFIQIWVDTNALQNGQTRGVYLVDNNLNHGSAQEGTPTLSTSVPTGTNICWQILNVDLNSSAVLSIQDIGNASVWGASGQPQKFNETTWTGQAQARGNAPYQVTFNAQVSTGSGITTSVNPTVGAH